MPQTAFSCRRVTRLLTYTEPSAAISSIEETKKLFAGPGTAPEIYSTSFTIPHTYLPIAISCNIYTRIGLFMGTQY